MQKNIRHNSKIFGTATLIFIFFLRLTALNEENFKATIADINGKAFAGLEELKEAELYQGIIAGERIKVEKNSETEIVFDNGNAVLLKKGEIGIKDDGVKIIDGEAAFEIVKGNFFEVDSPVSIIGVRGTEFVVKHKKEKTLVAVLKGKVELENPEFKKSKIILKKGKQSVVIKGFKPSKPIGISKEFLKNWKKKFKKFRKKARKHRKEIKKLLVKRLEVTKKKKKKALEEIKKRRKNFKNKWRN